MTRNCGPAIANASAYRRGQELKVTIQDEAQALTLKIEGRVAGAFVPELRWAWNNLAPSLKLKKVIVDLRGTTFLDAEGKQVLAEIHAKTRAEFLAASPLTKYFAEQVMQRVETNGKLRRLQ